MIADDCKGPIAELFDEFPLVPIETSAWSALVAAKHEQNDFATVIAELESRTVYVLADNFRGCHPDFYYRCSISNCTG